MALPVVVAEAAERDITESFHWYRNRSLAAAEDFRVEVVDAIDRIAHAPLSWKADDEGYRRLILRRFPYSDEVAQDVVRILAVAHNRKRPGYRLEY